MYSEIKVKAAQGFVLFKLNLFGWNCKMIPQYLLVSFWRAKFQHLVRTIQDWKQIFSNANLVHVKNLTIVDS